MTAELFIEIRCEELPARFVAPTAAALGRRVQALLKGISHGDVRTWATPRRLAVAIADVAEGRPVEEKVVTGPPLRAAKRDGEWTKGAQGFARGKGISVDELEVVDGPKGEVIAARVRTGGERTTDLIAQGLESAVLGIDFDRSMRWGTGRSRWARPVRGVVARYAGARIPCFVANIESGDTTEGHRLTPGPFSVTTADAWVSACRAHHVLCERDERRARITQQLNEAAASIGAEVGAWELLDEVVDLVEWPVVVTATFAEELLDLPSRLLVESMSVHQRTFPLFVGGVLTHRFLVVTNHPPAATDPDSAATIAAGNTKVLAARFTDAKFFYAEDRKQRLETHGAGLERMRWIRKAGTMADKASRISSLSHTLAPLFGADPARAARAGALAKADLCTQMVGEFPKLQGHVGRLLAGFDNEDKTTALAIEEHYLPRYSGDLLPTTAEGTTVALADRLDTLVGCFTRGLKPKGSADPLGLRRAAGGVVDLLVHSGINLPLRDLFSRAGAGEHTDDLAAFALARFRARQMETRSTDIVDAVLATGLQDVVALASRVQALDERAGTEAFAPLRTTFKRLVNIAGKHDSSAYDPAVLAEPAEQALHAAFVEVRDGAREAAATGRYGAALDALGGLRAEVDRLFEEVMVMAEDPKVRANRLGLLRSIADEFGHIADFSQLSA